MPEIDWLFAGLAIAVIGLGLIAFAGWRRPGWLGFRDKTLWDWVSLFMAPALIAAATLVVTNVQREVETRRAQETAIQNYVDRISTLVHETGPHARTQVFGRAHTTAVFQLVEGERAGRILVFLNEVGLIEDYVTNLEGLNFAEANLKGLGLGGLDFENTVLRRADLEEADLRWVDFEFADLRDADLKSADARNADFEGADVAGAHFAFADLRGADLSLSSGLVPAQIASACLDATTLLPEGFARPDGESEACTALPAERPEAGEGLPAMTDDDGDDDDEGEEDEHDD